MLVLQTVKCDGKRKEGKTPQKTINQSCENSQTFKQLIKEGHVVQFDSQALKMGSDPEAEGLNGRGL